MVLNHVSKRWIRTGGQAFSHRKIGSMFNNRVVFHSKSPCAANLKERRKKSLDVISNNAFSPQSRISISTTVNIEPFLCAGALAIDAVFVYFGFYIVTLLGHFAIPYKFLSRVFSFVWWLQKRLKTTNVNSVMAKTPKGNSIVD